MEVSTKTLRAATVWLSRVLTDSLHHFQKEGIRMFLFGALHSSSVVPSKVGRMIPRLHKQKAAHEMKRMYRLIDNKRISAAMQFEFYERRLQQYAYHFKELILAFDWTTVFNKFNLLCVSLVTPYGRTIPIAYTGYQKGRLKMFGSQNKIEEGLLKRIIAALPKNTKVVFIADRGFDRPAIPRLFIRLGVRFVIRASVGFWIKNTKRKRLISKKTLSKGDYQDFGTVEYTHSNPVELRLIGTWDKHMKEAWYLVTNLTYSDGMRIVKLYGKRMQIEEMFKSKKNSQVGFNWKYVRVRTLNRWLLLAFLITILFQFLAEISLTIAAGSRWKEYENYFTLCRRKKRVFSIYSLALLLIENGVHIVIGKRRGCLRVGNLCG